MKISLEDKQLKKEKLNKLLDVNKKLESIFNYYKICSSLYNAVDFSEKNYKYKLEIIDNKMGLIPIVLSKVSLYITIDSNFNFNSIVEFVLKKGVIIKSAEEFNKFFVKSLTKYREEQEAKLKSLCLIIEKRIKELLTQEEIDLITENLTNCFTHVVYKG